MQANTDLNGFLKFKQKLIDKKMLKMLEKELTDKIIKAYYNVYNELGYGFLEKVYQNAMYLELKSMDLFVEAQKRIKVYYKSIEVGEYFADLVINEKIIIELKAAEYLVKEHEAQLLNYLKGTDIELGLLFNFGKKPEFIRKIHTNDYK
jgi:GxxExxY protein